MIFDTYIEIEEVELDVKVTYSFTPELPAKINCLPDDAYPAEAAEIELESVMVFGKDILSSLSPEEKEEIEEKAMNHAVESAIDYSEQKADYDRSQREQF